MRVPLEIVAYHLQPYTVLGALNFLPQKVPEIDEPHLCPRQIKPLV